MEPLIMLMPCGGTVLMWMTESDAGIRLETSDWAKHEGHPMGLAFLYDGRSLSSTSEAHLILASPALHPDVVMLASDDRDASMWSSHER